MQEKLVEDCPPSVLVQYFDHAATDAAVHNRMTRQSNEVAIRQNESAIDGYERTLECLQPTKRSLEEAEAQAKGALHALKIRRSVLIDFSVSLQPWEVGNSLDLLARVGLQEDVDHA
ncbi:hypothetical protein HDU80_002437 [Chytriomyces hyalinus]|nr:hypothetical protein HDU80_002437 [Chytriomyces hyalinus]